MDKMYLLKVKSAECFDSFKKRVNRNLLNNKGDFVETLIKILISVVVGALVLGLIVLLINTIWPDVVTKVTDLFSAGESGGGGGGGGGG